MGVVRLPVAGAIFGEQCRVARELLRWQAIELAERAGVPLDTLERFEAGGETDGGTVRRLADTLMRQGISWPDDPLCPALDGFRFNNRTDNGVPCILSVDGPPIEEYRFRHPPLPLRSLGAILAREPDTDRKTSWDIRNTPVA